jgi:hypothetical protein
VYLQYISELCYQCCGAGAPQHAGAKIFAQLRAEKIIKFVFKNPPFFEEAILSQVLNTIFVDIYLTGHFMIISVF